MIIKKEDNEIQTSLTVETAYNFRKRLVGLMFRRTPLQKKALHLMPCNSIHMLFMRFSIDVLFLDQHMQVVKMVENLRPWAMVPRVKHAYSTVECPVGTIREYDIEVGDDLVL